MKKVEAINAECQQGMIITELAFIEAGRQAAQQVRSMSTGQVSATAVENLRAMPVSEGFFADQAAAGAPLMVAQQ